MMEAHVRQQFAVYGPQSQDREYFGFVFSLNGQVRSAVIRGSRCPHDRSCGIDTAKAARLIPPGAKVLGEWHTHPHEVKSRLLSMEDVRGAHANRRIRCYTAFYAASDGDIFGWDPARDSVPTAMASRIALGNYREGLVAGTLGVPDAPQL